MEGRLLFIIMLAWVAIANASLAAGAALGQHAAHVQFLPSRKSDWNIFGVQENHEIGFQQRSAFGASPVSPGLAGASLGLAAAQFSAITHGKKANDVIHGNQASEVPGMRPFTPDIEGSGLGSDVEDELGYREGNGSPSAERLPPSSQWDGARVPQWNSLAHIKLLKELDGQMPDKLMQSKSDDAAVTSQHQSTHHVCAQLNCEPFSPTPSQADYPMQSFGSPCDGPADIIAPFGAPSTEIVRGHSEHYYEPFQPPPMQLPPSCYLQQAGMIAERQNHMLGAHCQPVVDCAHIEEDERDQLLMRWNDAKRKAVGEGKPMQPTPLLSPQRVDANVRDFVSRARYAAGQGVDGDGKAGAAAVRGVRKEGFEAPQVMNGQLENWELACPGSPVSSMWSQDPCGYWVQDGWGGGEQHPKDFDLGPVSALRPDIAPFHAQSEGSAGDLWSTAEGEEGELSSYHFELEKTFRCEQESVLGVRAGGDSGASACKADHWSDQFVPRPLRLEFARELRWFAWHGREETPNTGVPTLKRDVAEEGKLASKPKPAAEAKTTRRRTKTQIRKQQEQHPWPPFSLSLPRSLSFMTSPSLFPLSLRLRSTAPDQAAEDGDREMQEADEKDKCENKLGGHNSEMTNDRFHREHSGTCRRYVKNGNILGSPGVSGERCVGVQEYGGSVCKSEEESSGWCGMMQRGKSLHVSSLDHVQLFKIREMLREMHRLLVSHPRQLLVGNGDDGAGAEHWKTGPSSWTGSGDGVADGVMWRLIMYDAMMHSQSLVAAAGLASVNDGIAILDRMTAAGVPPTLNTYNKYLAVIAGAAGHGHGNGTHAQDVFVRMEEAGIEPDRESYWAWLSVLGSAVYHGQATMQQVYLALQHINKPAKANSEAAVGAMLGNSAFGNSAACSSGAGGMVQEDIKCLQLCLRAAVGGAQRGVAGKADVEWVLRRIRSLQLEADHDTWILAMQVLVNAAQRGHASVSDAEQLLDRAEAAGYVASPMLYCGFFQAAAAASNSNKHKYAIDARERVIARLARLERHCEGADPSLRQSLLPLTQAVRAYVQERASVCGLKPIDSVRTLSKVRGRGGRGGKALMAPGAHQIEGAKSRKKSVPAGVSK